MVAAPVLDSTPKVLRSTLGNGVHQRVFLALCEPFPLKGKPECVSQEIVVHLSVSTVFSQYRPWSLKIIAWATGGIVCDYSGQ